MDSVVARKPRPWERQRLHRMKRQLGNAVNSRHARAILLSWGGVSNRRIAELCDCSARQVRKILHRFNSGGIEAITWYPLDGHCGGSRKFSPDVVEQICEVALSPPRQLIGMAVWSLAKLRDYLVAQRIVPGISRERLRQLLRERKICWRHTKTWKESPDPEFWAKYRRVRRLYGHRPAGGRRICVDEFGPLNLQPRHGRHWARVGHVDRLRATYKRTAGVRHMYGAYDLERDRLTVRFVPKKNWESFLAFLKWLRRRYREVLYIVLDNASYHRQREVLRYAETHRIRLYFTPSHASWLNRIESHFTALKKFALDNTDFRSHADQQDAIVSYVDWRNGDRALCTTGWLTYKRSRRHAA